VFYPGNAFEAKCALPDGRLISLVYRSNYQAGFEVPLPTFFYVEAIGEAPNLKDASEAFYGAALETTTVMAFVVNADLGHLEVELVFDCSPDKNEHEFRQTYVPNVPVLHVPGRPISPELVRDFFALVTDHPHRTRLQRAITQYGEALRRWTSGHGLVCLAHLYMGVEALTKACLWSHLQTTGMSQDQLGAAWNVDLKRLDSEVRRRLIFQEDDDCFKAARGVSDKFEHGYGDFLEMHEPAARVVVKVAAYLRKAIIGLSGADANLSAALLGHPYAEPRGPFRLIKHISGTLVGPANKLAAKDRSYPAFKWTSGVKEVSIDQGGRYAFAPEETLTAEFGEGVSLNARDFQVWDNQLVAPKD